MDLYILTFLLLLLCLLGLSWFAGTDAPYVATHSEKIKKILKEAGVRKGKIFYELGSGDGRVVMEAARMGAKSIGIEQSILRVWYSQYKARREGIKNSFFYHGNIFRLNYKDADIIFIFLLPQGIDKLEPKLKKELKKGTIIITQAFHFPNIKPIKKVDLSDKDSGFLSADKSKKHGDFWIYRI